MYVLSLQSRKIAKSPAGDSGNLWTQNKMNQSNYMDNREHWKSDSAGFLKGNNVYSLNVVYFFR